MEVIYLIKATKIKMQSGKEKSNSITEIESIYLTGVKVETYYKKENLYDFIVNNPTQLIQVNIEPYPTLIAAVKNGQKYVRSAPNETTNDNLLNLPRE
mgnify:CR=1 FL=1